ncbi:hypothetical protein C8F04DRAFT_541663 [Mycena alexandri]|uniref:Uncharacterized protein n=1 Tax=Mycena alexandri TaxID=1745969 RepID=A0AAD6SXE6_9AGAR|nr:hypothetical protein C8F04DRAFT_541663 [Mycena alexandri]
MHFALSFPLLLATAAVARKCAVCPQTISEPGEEEYELVSTEYQPNTVVCGYFLPQVPPTRMKRNGWKYCTYDDMGKIMGTNLDYCPAPVPTKASPKCS